MDAGPSPHAKTEILQAYGLGTLDVAAAEVVSKHLAGCPDCRRQFADMTASSLIASVAIRCNGAG